LTFIIKILGSNSAAPAFNRHPTSQLIQIQQDNFLVDCGEGTQMQMLRYKVRMNRINCIFISHLHGDHYLGLIGLLSTLHLQKRTHDLCLFGPPGLAEILSLQFKYSQTRLNYKILFYELKEGIKERIFENEFVTVDTIPLHHRIQCAGFLFREKPKKRRVNIGALPEYFLPSQMNALKRGEDIYDEAGLLIYRNEELTFPPKHSRSYAFCSDTAYFEDIIPHIKGVDLLYHESTFLEEQAERAAETFHSTAHQAALIAKKAGVGRLVLGHYSARYQDVSPFLEEARKVFEPVLLSQEGQNILIEDRVQVESPAGEVPLYEPVQVREKE
jgi:ribonuclease Z